MKSHGLKRFLDLASALTLFIVASPVYLLCVTGVWLIIRRPVHFRQERLGRDGVPFRMYKFRTMNNRRNADGSLLPDEERINFLGRFLRHTSLDELPQLINIIKGDMSLVGPRPQLACFTSDCSLDELRRFKALPGLTGLAQIKGRNAITWRQKFRFDVWYVDHYSLLLDLRIILMTIPAVLARRGVEKVEPEEMTFTLETSDGAEVIHLHPEAASAEELREAARIKAKAAR
ncbi:MAG: sugar transferase [bacterium]|nr:sugar transferase [bacterium]